MIIPTMTNNSFLWRVNKYRDRFMLELEKRKAYRLTIAIFVAIAVIVFAVIVRPVPFSEKPSRHEFKADYFFNNDGFLTPTQRHD